MNSLIQTSSPGISERKILQGGLVVGACILAGQVLGFLRQATIAYLLGTGPPADALAVAFAPVDLWFAVLATTVIFGFGPLLTAPVRSPGFAGLARPVVPAAVAGTLACALLAKTVAGVFAPGLSGETAVLASQLVQITALAIPAVSVSTLFTAFLYGERKFALAAFHQGTVNAVTIAAALVLHSRLGAAAFAIGYVAGTWLQLGAVWWIARTILRRHAGGAHGAEGRLFLRPAAVLCYSLFIGLNPAVTRALASTFGPGSTAAFDYCLKLTGVPLALLVTPLASSLLSEIAPFGWRGDPRVAMRTIVRAAVAVAFVASLAAAFVLGLAPLLVSMLFERGKFDETSTVTVAAMLAGFFPVLIGWSALDIISRSLFGLGRWRAPVACAAIALSVNLVLSSTGLITSARWTGIPMVSAFGCSAAVAAVCLRRIGGSPGDGAERPA